MLRGSTDGAGDFGSARRRVRVPRRGVRDGLTVNAGRGKRAHQSSPSDTTLSPKCAQRNDSNAVAEREGVLAGIEDNTGGEAVSEAVA